MTFARSAVSEHCCPSAARCDTPERVSMEDEVTNPNGQKYKNMHHRGTSLFNNFRYNIYTHLNRKFSSSSGYATCTMVSWAASARSNAVISRRLSTQCPRVLDAGPVTLRSISSDRTWPAQFQFHSPVPRPRFSPNWKTHELIMVSFLQVRQGTKCFSIFLFHQYMNARMHAAHNFTHLV